MAVAEPPRGGRRFELSFSVGPSVSDSAWRELSLRNLNSSASCSACASSVMRWVRDVGTLLEPVHFDEVVRAECGRALLVGAAGAEQVSELEHERDEVDRDQERGEELNVLRHAWAGLLDACERRLAGEKVAVGLQYRGGPGLRSPGQSRRSRLLPQTPTMATREPRASGPAHPNRRPPRSRRASRCSACCPSSVIAFVVVQVNTADRRYGGGGSPRFVRSRPMVR